jgi:outer membrane protein TolC
MGIPFEIELLLTDELKLIEVPRQTPEDAMLVAMANRVELEAQARRQRLANLTLSSVKSERLPSLSGTGDVGLVGLQPGDVLTTHNLELLLSIPIFDGGQREGRISESRSQVRQEDIRAKDLRFQVTLEVREALLTLESAKQQVAVAEEGRQQALLEVELARERFAVGVATNIEVTNAQTSLAIARDNVIQALFRFNASRVNLARAQGRMQDL